MEERIRSIRALGISSRHRPRASTQMLCPPRSTLQPKCSRISTDASTSESRGQLCNRQPFWNKMAAANRGSTLFLAPETAILPSRGRPPSTTIDSIGLLLPP